MIEADIIEVDGASFKVKKIEENQTAEATEGDTPMSADRE